MAVLITSSSGNTEVAEAGQLDTYKIQLVSEPIAPVTVTITADRQTLIAKPNRPLHRPFKIMPIGDSITYGVIDSFKNTQSGGYRTYLWKHLKRDGYTVNFVGSQSDGPSSIDRDHEGYRGKTIDEIANAVDESIENKKTDVVLLLAGTNDILRNLSLAKAPQRLCRLIDQISKQSDAAILVGTLPPNTRSPVNLRRIQAFNRAIVQSIYKKWHDQLVQWVDLYNSLSNRDLADRTHPTAKGYQKMANAWYNSLLGLLNSPENMSLAETQTFTFTPQNWQKAQTVTVVAQNDRQIEGIHQSSLVHQTHSADIRFNDLETVLPIKVVDDDPGIGLIPLDSQQPLQPGKTVNYQVTLSRQPTAKAIVHLSADSQLHLSRSKLTFTPAQWQQPQIIAVEALPQSKPKNRYQGIVQYTIQSKDYHYQVLGKKQIVLTIHDRESNLSATTIDPLLQSSGTQKRTSSLKNQQKIDDRLLRIEFSTDRSNVDEETIMNRSTGMLIAGYVGALDQFAPQVDRSLNQWVADSNGSNLVGGRSMDMWAVPTLR